MPSSLVRRFNNNGYINWARFCIYIHRCEHEQPISYKQDTGIYWHNYVHTSVAYATNHSHYGKLLVDWIRRSDHLWAQFSRFNCEHAARTCGSMVNIASNMENVTDGIRTRESLHDGYALTRNILLNLFTSRMPTAIPHLIRSPRKFHPSPCGGIY